MRDEGWQARLQKSVAERREWAAKQPAPWWIVFDAPARGIFAEGDDRHAIHRMLYGMREPVSPAPTDRAGVTYYALDDLERIVVDESDMPAVMRCVRMSGYHGSYRKAGIPREDPEYREYRF